MFIILKESAKSETQETLAVNFSTQDQIEIRQGENIFQLGFLQWHDAHLSSQSSLFTPIATFDSYKECMALFDQIIDAMKEGKQILDLRECGTSSILLSENIPTV